MCAPSHPNFEELEANSKKGPSNIFHLDALHDNDRCFVAAADGTP